MTWDDSDERVDERIRVALQTQTPGRPDVDAGWQRLVSRLRRQRRRRLVLVVVGAIAVVLAVVVPLSVYGGSRPSARVDVVGGPTPTVSLEPGVWRASTPRSLISAGALTCPTASSCYVGASGMPMEVTTDAGATWTSVNLPAGLILSGQISCFNPDTCVTLALDHAGHDLLIKTTNGGRSWSSTPGPPEATSQSTIRQPPIVDAFPPDILKEEPFIGPTCVSPRDCVVVTLTDLPGMNAVEVTTNGGRSWVQPRLPADFQLRVEPVTRVQCLRDGTCMIPGVLPTGPDGWRPSVISSRDGGLTWALGSVPPMSQREILDIACTDSSHCLAATESFQLGRFSVLATTDGGKSWFQQPGAEPFSGALIGLSCAPGSECWAAGSGGAYQPDWPAGALALTDDLGRTWQPVPFPSQLQLITTYQITCPNASTCFALFLSQNLQRAVWLTYRK